MFGYGWYALGKDVNELKGRLSSIAERQKSIEAKLDELLKRAPVTQEDMNELRGRLGSATERLGGAKQHQEPLGHKEL